MSKRLLFTEEFEKSVVDFYLEPNTLNETVRQFNLNNRVAVKKILAKYNISLHNQKVVQTLKQEKSKQTCLEKYGVEFTFQAEDTKQKIKETNLERYGVEYATQLKETIDKRYETNIKKYGHANVGKIGSPEFKKAMQEKYGCENAMQNKQLLDKAHATNLEKYGSACVMNSDECIEKRKQQNIEKYGVEWHTQTTEYHQKSQKKYVYDDERFDSFYELCFYIYNKDNNINIKRCPTKIEYEYENKKHYYIPDFLVEDELVEIKGPQFVKEDGTWQNPYDHDNDKLFEAKRQCAISNSVKIIYNCEKYLDYFYNKGYNKNNFMLN